MRAVLLLIPLLLFLESIAAMAGPRTSANYGIATDSLDQGGRRAASAAYTHDGSVGGITGIATAAPSQTAKTGYLGQLHEVTGFSLTGGAASVNEGGTVQLGARQELDDATFLIVPPGEVAWSVAGGPLATIATNGLATAGVVFENTGAVAQGDFSGATATFALTVLETTADNFGLYTGDGLDDAWQVQYFGQNNPAAAPLIDADGDGQDNGFEFTAGLVPTDPQSRFETRIERVPGQTSQWRVVFSPVVAGRSYVVESSPTLAGGSWDPLTGATESDDGDERTVTDPDATSSRKNYRVGISQE